MTLSNIGLSRMRTGEVLRDLIAESYVRVTDLVQPVFVHYGVGVEREISSMPGQYQFSVDRACEYIRRIYDAGVRAVLLFGIPEKKNATGSDAMSDDGIIQQAVRAIKRAVPDMFVITDVCFCEYTEHGHCGVLVNSPRGMVLDHEATCRNLAMQVLTHARAGADMVAPSGMIDGQVLAIRQALDGNGYNNIPVMSYAAKYASAFYGPFREAAQGAPSFGDRRSHQMDPRNSDEALREVKLDIEQGADIIMIKPGMPYLDIVRRVKDNFNVPVAVYNVSGEYAMVKAAAANGWLDERQTVLEIMTGFKRAGADIIISYHASDVVGWL